MDVERERLSALYKGYTDEQLLALSRDEASLTDAAQTAITEELTARGLEYGPASEELESGFGPGIPGIFPSSAAVMEKALEPGGEIEGDMEELVTLFDGHELTRACEHLEAAGIALEVRQREGNALTGSPSWYELWVPVGAIERSQDILREKLGYFPKGELAEEDGHVAPAGAEDDTMSIVATMDTQAEAQEAIRLLARDGFAARLSKLDGEGEHSVEVKNSERERALTALAGDLGIDA